MKDREAENPSANSSASPTNSDGSVQVELRLRFSQQIQRVFRPVVCLGLKEHNSALTPSEDEDTAADATANRGQKGLCCKTSVSTVHSLLMR